MVMRRLSTGWSEGTTRPRPRPPPSRRRWRWRRPARTHGRCWRPPRSPPGPPQCRPHVRLPSSRPWAGDRRGQAIARQTRKPGASSRDGTDVTGPAPAQASRAAGNPARSCCGRPRQRGSSGDVPCRDAVVDNEPLEGVHTPGCHRSPGPLGAAPGGRRHPSPRVAPAAGRSCESDSQCRPTGHLDVPAEQVADRIVLGEGQQPLHRGGKRRPVPHIQPAPGRRYPR
jgi:hypothetical protein